MQEYPRVVKLKDGRSVKLRPLVREDFDKLHAFFQALEPEDRLFLRDDVTDPELIRKWTDNIDWERVVPIVAEDGEAIVADGTLHNNPYGWSQHVGLLRLVVASSHRDAGLGTLLARELVGIAEARGLEKLQANVIEGDQLMLNAFKAMGFGKEAVVREAVKDQQGNNHSLAIMINDVADLGRSLEDWISDTMIPSFRVPGAGA